MKKFLLISILFLSACSTTVFRPYDGDKEIIGEGGFYKYYVSSEDMWIDRDYPNTGVSYYISGLPKNEKCKLLGHISGDNANNIISKTIVKLGGNTATQSAVSFPLKFEKSEGVMSVGSSGYTDVVNTGNLTSIIQGYNVFNCK